MQHRLQGRVLLEHEHRSDFFNYFVKPSSKISSSVCASDNHISARRFDFSIRFRIQPAGDLFSRLSRCVRRQLMGVQKAYETTGGENRYLFRDQKQLTRDCTDSAFGAKSGPSARADERTQESRWPSRLFFT
jgi:hypothetical protein